MASKDEEFGNRDEVQKPSRTEKQHGHKKNRQKIRQNLQRLSIEELLALDEEEEEE